VGNKPKDWKRRLPKYKGPASWFNGSEKDWREKVDAAKRRLVGAANPEDANVARLARKVATARREKHELEERISELNLDLAALDEVMAQVLENEEQQSVKLSDGVVVYLKRTVYPSIFDKQKSFAWMKKHLSPAELFGMLSVHPSTYKSFVTDLVERGEEPPAGTKVFIKVSAACRGMNGDE